MKLAKIITQVPQGSKNPAPVYGQNEESEEEVELSIVCGEQRQSDKGKKTLVLDLDETLVHSSF